MEKQYYKSAPNIELPCNSTRKKKSNTGQAELP